MHPAHVQPEAVRTLSFGRMQGRQYNPVRSRSAQGRSDPVNCAGHTAGEGREEEEQQYEDESAVDLRCCGGDEGWEAGG